ncbi:hypothetical protein [Sutcliffiella horikoshii]|uniref:hypothetical protein n=1 Tax=Sutcliffiella horikoshii TaxID=79883 RepID=UPI001F33D531|nr:hypothetical protein [Sutcliffiella horikoshii]MCG1022886.1 hypothetical protein [Sutcliffiella horikoshii]
MKLFGWILLSAFICIGLAFTGEIAIFLICAIILGILIRCLTLLLDIKTRLAQITKAPDPVRDAYDNYLTEKLKKVEKDV